MSINHWQQLLESIETNGNPEPVSDMDLDSFESRWGHRLPLSYRTFCRVFGPGELAGWYCISTPNYKGKYKERYDLETKTRENHDGRDWRENSSNPMQFQRALIFADDSATAIYFWDPEEVSIRKNNEYTIYAMFRDWSLRKLCNSFEEFVGICLQQGDIAVRLYDEKPKLEFRAAVTTPKRRRL